LVFTKPINAAATLPKETPKVVGKEDNVSRQAGKPTYLKTWANDGQT